MRCLPRMIFFRRFLVVVCFLLLALFAACGGGDNGGTPSPTAVDTATPTPTVAVHTPGPTGTPPETSYRLVFREFTLTEDIIWSALPGDPSQREEIVRIPHREGYGIKPSLSPDGKLLAYLSLPDFALSAQSSQAEAFVMDLETKESVMVGNGMDFGFRPLWTPDSRLIYLRQYAGPEFLSADVILVRIFVEHPDVVTPTPTPTLAPDQTPAPSPTMIEEILRDSVAHVLAFAPIGFAADDRAMFFVQLQGGTSSGSLVGLISPGTYDAVVSIQQLADAAKRDADAENQRLAAEAIANGQPPPDPTVSPAPTPAPDVRLVVDMSDQQAFDYSLSPDSQKVSFLVQEFSGDGSILNRAYIADLIQGTSEPFPAPGLSIGHHLRPVWAPDGRLTLGVLPEDGGPGQLAVSALDLSSVLFLPQAESGFDQPRMWAPDGSWLAVAHSSGSSLANPGIGRLDLVAITGHRVTVIEGVDNITEDSVLGWIDVSQSEDSGG